MCGSSEINCKIYNDMVIETQACVSACTPSEMYSLISQTRNLPPPTTGNLGTSPRVLKMQGNERQRQ